MLLCLRYWAGNLFYRGMIEYVYSGIEIICLTGTYI